MIYKEEKIATFTDEKTRIQLLKITSHPDINPEYTSYMTITKYQIRVNRKRIYNTGFENDARKYFAIKVQNSILQLKII